MEVPLYLRRLGLAALVLALAACIHPADLRFTLTRDHSAGASGRIQGMQIDLGMRLGDGLYDAVYQLTRDGHMHLGIHHEDSRVYS